MAVIRRSAEDLERVQFEDRTAAYILDEQVNFAGTEEQLKMMQNFELAYVDGQPKVSDEEWDLLKKKFNYKESLTPGSPSGREWVKLTAPLPSIDKVGSFDELEEWLDRFPQQMFKIECKLDGMTANMRYKLTGDEYILESVSSRGNGRYGLKIKKYALEGVSIGGMPRRIPSKSLPLPHNMDQLPEYFEIRGEGVIPKSEQSVKRYLNKELKEAMEQENNPEDLSLEPVVWRSIVSGMFNREVPMNLPGLLQYLYQKTLDQLLEEHGVTEGGKRVFHVYELANARLIASLLDDPHRFLRNSKLLLHEDGLIEILHADGGVYRDFPYEERMDIISYSCGVNGVNLDIDLTGIPGLLTIDSLEIYEDESWTKVKQSPIFAVTDDHQKIFEKVALLYGTGMEGKRIPSKKRLRNHHKYAVDGVVIKLLNSTKETQGLDCRPSKSNSSKMVIPKYPSDAIAIKLLSEAVKVKLMKIVENETKLGNKTYSGQLDKAYRTESGAWVSSINLHNGDWLAENNWIQEGREYMMCMAFDIIPQLLPIPINES